MTHATRGFSLVELLVALAVFALVVVALLNLSGGSTRTALQIETRALAGIVAENLAVEAMTAPSLPVGETSGQVDLAGQAWRWRRIVTGTEVPGMGRIDIAVYSDEGLAADRTLFRSAGA